MDEHEHEHEFLSQQEKTTAEWDEMAEQWDTVASWYADGLYNVLWQQTGDALSLSSTLSSTEKLDEAQQYRTKDSLVVLDFGCGTGLLTEKLQKDVKTVLAIDAAPKMISVLQDKIKTKHWNDTNNDNNVHAICTTVLAPMFQMDTDENNEDSHNDDKTENLSAQQDESHSTMIRDTYFGKVDLIVASSIMSFIPAEDLAATMKVLGNMLRPNGGVFCHLDWFQQSKEEEEEKDCELQQQGMTMEKALSMYKMAGLTLVSTDTIKMNVDNTETVDVFCGVAKKE